MLERLLFAHLRRRHGAARLAGRGTPHLKSIRGTLSFLRRAADDFGKLILQPLGFDFVEFLGNGRKDIAQAPGIDDAQHQVAGAHLRFAEHQGRENPTALHGLLDMHGQIRNRGGAARQAVQGISDVRRQARGLEIELANDAMQVRVLQLQHLMDPVHQLDIGIAAHLAEHRRALDGAVSDAIQLAEQCRTTD